MCCFSPQARTYKGGAKKALLSRADCQKPALLSRLSQPKSITMQARIFPHHGTLVLLTLLLALSCLLNACDDGKSTRQQRVRDSAVFKIEARDIPLTAELSGRVSAFRKAEVRPQVSGILQEQLFTEGSLVKAGQSLYKIDPDTYDAEVESAKAAVASADATLHAAKLRLDRRIALLRSQAVSQQAYEDARAEYLQAKANLEVAKASLKTAEIHLRYTDVLAPITGRIGKSNVTQGALVTANQADELAVIQQLDPVYVDMTQSSFALLVLRDRYAAGNLVRPGDDTSTEVTLTLENGRTYPLKGELKFADITVDESTGSVLLRSVFKNPDFVLLPGMYVKACISQGVKMGALLVPQRAVRRDPKGNASVFVLANGKAEFRPIVGGDMVGRFLMVSEGLKEGELVLLEGIQNMRPGMPVNQTNVLTVDTYGKSRD